MAEVRFVPVARFLPEPEAFAMAGRLQAEGIDARVAPQGDTFVPYRAPMTPGAVFMVIVPEPDGARARWVIERIRQDDGDDEDWQAGPSKGPGPAEPRPGESKGP